MFVCTVCFCVCADMHNMPQHLNFGDARTETGSDSCQSARDPLPGASIENSDTSDSFFPGRRDISEFQKTYGSRGKKHAEEQGCSCDMPSLQMCVGK